MSTQLKQREEQSTQRRVLVVLGPFTYEEPKSGKTLFETDSRTLVPKWRVWLDNERMYKVYRVPTGPFHYSYFVVYKTENIDFYKYYIARVPENAEEVKRMKVPRRADCGSYSAYGDADDLYRARCGSENVVSEVVWEEKQLPALILLGDAGVYVVTEEIPEYRDIASSSSVEEVEVIAEGEGKLGNVECK